MTTDSYVVQPMFFPGGKSATSPSTARSTTWPAAAPSRSGSPRVSSSKRVSSWRCWELSRRPWERQAANAGVAIVTGDTKVVGKGSADQLFVNTAGVGVVPPGVDIGPEKARPGDHIIVSGNIGEHGVAIMSVREGIDFGTVVTTDSAPLHRLVAAMLAACEASDAAGAVHALRDPTRGGLVASVVEIARAASVGVELDESKIPVPETVSSACSFLGLDPLQVANEGKIVAFVDPSQSAAVLAAMRARPEGRTPRSSAVSSPSTQAWP